MKVHLSTWSLHRLFFQKLLRITDMPMLARSLGFDGVELEDVWFSSPWGSAVRALKSSSQRFGMPVLIAVSNDFTVGSAKSLGTQIRHTMNFLRIANVLGSRTVRVLVGSKNPSRNRLQQIVSALREILTAARDLHLRLAIENHDPLSRNAKILESILMQVGGPDLGVCLDLGNLNPRTRYADIERLASNALMLHAKTHGFSSSGGETTIDYRRCFRILRKHGFRGPVVAEYDGPGDQLIGSLKTLALVRRFSL